MSLLPRPRIERRSVSYQDVWGSDSAGNSPFQGDSVQNALRLAAVYSATSLIADLLSTSPLRAYIETPDGIRTQRAKQPALLSDPDPYGGTIVDWLHQGISSALLTGNAWGYVLAVDSQGVPSKVAWLNPSAVSVIETQQYQLGGKATYYWNGMQLDPTLLVHVPGYTVPGSVRGLSPLALFKAQIETGLSAQQFADDWYKNGAAPAGHFKNVAKELTKEQAASFKDNFKAAVSGRDVLVTGNDWDWHVLGVPADQAKFLETIQATATQIAAIYKVAPDDVGGTVASSLTYKTLLQDQVRLNQRALRPWARRFEQVLTNLLTRPVYACFDLDVNAQGTVLERMQAHEAAMGIGVETQTEARTAENKPPLTPEEKADWLAFKSAGPVKPLVAPMVDPAAK